MGIGRTLADRKGKDCIELPKETNSRSKKSRRRQKKAAAAAAPLSPVQKLFETCREVFASGGNGVVPPPARVEQLRSVLDSLRPADVGLTPDMPYFRTSVAGQPPVITYLHLYDCPKFSIGIFCLPRSAVIPLHNHPGMTVFSKLLLGSMHIKAFDWAADSHSNAAATVDGSKAPSAVRLAKLKVDSDFTAPCGTSILYPSSGGNMHCFTALTACAVLDVLGPPYSDPDDPDGRHCQYYLDLPFPSVSGDGLSVPEEEKDSYAWLQEREKPGDLAVVGSVYRGPKILGK